MRNIMDVLDSILRKIPKDVDLHDKIVKFRNSISYRAPEMHLELGSWHELHEILVSAMDEHHSKLWYCEVLSIFSTNQLDDIIKALHERYGSAE